MLSRRVKKERIEIDDYNLGIVRKISVKPSRCSVPDILQLKTSALSKSIAY